MWKATNKWLFNEQTTCLQHKAHLWRVAFSARACWCKQDNRWKLLVLAVNCMCSWREGRTQNSWTQEVCYNVNLLIRRGSFTNLRQSERDLWGKKMQRRGIRGKVNNTMGEFIFHCLPLHLPTPPSHIHYLFVLVQADPDTSPRGLGGSWSAWVMTRYVLLHRLNSKQSFRCECYLLALQIPQTFCLLSSGGIPAACVPSTSAPLRPSPDKEAELFFTWSLKLRARQSESLPLTPPSLTSPHPAKTTRPLLSQDLPTRCCNRGVDHVTTLSCSSRE